jgi:flavin-dependent dehydrogenase
LKAGGERLFFVGDSASYAEPFTGEGISWAIESASQLAPLVIAGVNQWTPAIERHWQAHQEKLWRRQKLSLMLCKLLRYPTLTRTMVSVLSGIPAASSPLVRYVNGFASLKS